MGVPPRGARRHRPIDVVWVFLPVLGAPVVHAPILRSDLMRAFKRPLDGGRTLRGRRVLGDNKTWRGALAMSGGVAAAAAVLSRWPWHRERLPRPLRRHPLAYGVLLGLGIVVGELPNSMLKRQLDIPAGRQRRSPAGLALSVLDQGDLVLGSWAMLAPLWRMSAAEGACAFAVVSAVHVPINLVGHAIGARSSRA